MPGGWQWDTSLFAEVVRAAYSQGWIPAPPPECWVFTPPKSNPGPPLTFQGDVADERQVKYRLLASLKARGLIFPSEEEPAYPFEENPYGRFSFSPDVFFNYYPHGPAAADWWLDPYPDEPEEG